MVLLELIFCGASIQLVAALWCCCLFAECFELLGSVIDVVSVVVVIVP